jgi:hypothetical protein
MKVIKYMIILVLTSIMLQSQAQYYSPSLYKPGNVTLGIGPVMLLNTEASFPLAGTFSMQYFLGSRFCLKSDLVMGDNYIHFGLGFIGMISWMSFNSRTYSVMDVNEIRGLFTQIVSFIIFTTLSFEQMSYHIPVSRHSDISPSLSLLRFTFQPGGFHSGAAVGCRYNYHHDRFIFSPYAEYSVFYDNERYSFNIGITASYLLKPKRGRFI